MEDILENFKQEKYEKLIVEVGNKYFFPNSGPENNDKSSETLKLILSRYQFREIYFRLIAIYTQEFFRSHFIPKLPDFYFKRVFNTVFDPINKPTDIYRISPQKRLRFIPKYAFIFYSPTLTRAFRNYILIEPTVSVTIHFSDRTISTFLSSISIARQKEIWCDFPSENWQEYLALKKNYKLFPIKFNDKLNEARDYLIPLVKIAIRLGDAWRFKLRDMYICYTCRSNRVRKKYLLDTHRCHDPSHHFNDEELKFLTNITWTIPKLRKFLPGGYLHPWFKKFPGNFRINLYQKQLVHKHYMDHLSSAIIVKN